MTVVVCPGSFDPPTNGHVDVFERCAALFDRVVVAVVANPSKQPLFSIDERVGLVRAVTAHLDGVDVEGFEGLVVEFARSRQATAIVKGVRGPSDFDYEWQMASMNNHLTGIDTVLVPAAPAVSFISASLVREIARLGGAVDTLVPAAVAAALKEKLQ